MLLPDVVLPVFKLEECRNPPKQTGLPDFDLCEAHERGHHRRSEEREPQRSEEPPARRRRKILPLMRYRAPPPSKPRVKPVLRQPRPRSPRRKKEAFDYASMHGGTTGFRALGDGFGAANDVASWMRKFAHSARDEPPPPLPKKSVETTTTTTAAVLRKPRPAAVAKRRPPVPAPALPPDHSLRLARGRRAEAARRSRDRQLAARDAFLDAQVAKVQPESLMIEKRQRYLGAQPKPTRRARRQLKDSSKTESEPHLRRHRELLERYKGALLPGDVRAWREGDAVLVKWDDGARYPGLVARVDDRSADVRFVDGDSRDDVPLSDLEAPSWRVGDACRCLWEEDGEWYSGIVNAVAGTTVDVLFDDGDRRHGAPLAHLAKPADDDESTDVDGFVASRNVVVDAAAPSEVPPAVTPSLCDAAVIPQHAVRDKTEIVGEDDDRDEEYEVDDESGGGGGGDRRKHQPAAARSSSNQNHVDDEASARSQIVDHQYYQVAATPSDSRGANRGPTSWNSSADEDIGKPLPFVSNQRASDYGVPAITSGMVDHQTPVATTRSDGDGFSRNHPWGRDGETSTPPPSDVPPARDVGKNGGDYDDDDFDDDDDDDDDEYHDDDFEEDAS
ncbi:hypothetical protein CTAYLR_005145 [Chrysophaeum taylorii]|uniref:Tudor domain-containing protein n=1 Tax=Chrysophaeum taylorii TaxID=2483200 RepID=A0AAD7UEQ9_9STRA|nr:hypothetical protein CTAYLR_005145 [Chrysophaeum taylorii]